MTSNSVLRTASYILIPTGRLASRRSNGIRMVEAKLKACSSYSSCAWSRVRCCVIEAFQGLADERDWRRHTNMLFAPQLISFFVARISVYFHDGVFSKSSRHQLVRYHVMHAKFQVSNKRKVRRKSKETNCIVGSIPDDAMSMG